MTVIATFDYPNYPMVFGDMLLSGNEVPDRKVSIPTIGDVRNFFPEGSGWTITGASQKIAIVSDDCVVAWAGSWIAARSVISELKDVAAEEPLTPEVVIRFLRHLDADIQALGLSLVGFLRTRDGFFRISHNTELDFEMHDGTAVSAAGSGANYLRTFLKGSRLGERIGGNNKNVHPAQLAYELGLQLGVSFLRSENTLGDTLRLYFGGGYEVAVFNGERFTKDRGVTYVLWDWRKPDKYGFAIPSLVVVNEYKGDILCQRSQEFQPKEDSSGFDIGNIRVGIYSPIYRPVQLPSAIAPEDITQATPWICHAFIGLTPEGKVRRLALTDHLKHDGTDKISFETQKGVILRVNTKKEFWNDLSKALAAF